VHVVSNASPVHDVTAVSMAPPAPSSMNRVYAVTASTLVTPGAVPDSEMLEVV
jgi:hypothetical protein